MVQIKKTDSHFIFEVKGLHKLWSFRKELKIPIDNIVKAYQNKEELNKWKGWRVPGTYIPFVITAGTFYLDGDKIFWDVVNKDKTIIIDLKDEEFRKLIIEVEDPDIAIDLINS